MASDFSSGCTDDIDIFEEKEEGELSLEDVSSSEESHPNYRSDFRVAGRCVSCTSAQMCAPWCLSARAARKTHRKLDAAHGKENRLHAKDPSATVSKHLVATLQEKNDDLVPISSDSDMEIVGLPGNSKQQLHSRSKSAKVRKKKKKKRSHGSVVRIEDSLSPPSPQLETYLVEVSATKKIRPSRSHHRESSPTRFPLERPLARSPNRRYRGTRIPKSRSPPLRSRSPSARAILLERKSPRRSRSPVLRPNLLERKSPRKMRSPRRSPPRSPVRSGPGRATRERVPSPPEETLVDNYATRLLKKVRRLESVSSGSVEDLKSKEHSSLKEKLSNMMKNQEVSHEKPNSRKRDTNVAANSNSSSSNTKSTTNGASAAAESDEEEDIELLRRLALETKQKKAETKVEESKPKSETANAEESDDNDIEADQLRILALRSAILKKHEKRVTRGVNKSRKPAKPATRVESPFNESFLDDIDISGEEDATSPAARFSPVLDDENNHPEDMDLDTDVEREKENDFLSPYSPTDDLSRGMVMEDELDEEFDNNNEGKLSPTREELQGSEVRGHDSSDRSGYLAGIDTPYSPSAPTETPNMSKFVSRRRRGSEYLNCYLPGVDTPFSPPTTPDARRMEKFTSRSKNVTTTDSPMSPTETPDLDPVLFPIFPDLPAVAAETQNVEDDEGKKDSASAVEDVEAARNVNSAAIDEKIGEVEQDSTVGLEVQKEKCDSTVPIAEDSASPSGDKCFRAVDVIDKLPEIDLDGSPLVPVSKELEGAEIVIPIVTSPEVQNPEEEPLYLQSLSEVAKDTNKMSSLVSRTLVPALILKTNKQLQQPLPQKKVESHTEPSFKSAEMRPVSVETAKSTTMFKPIKLCPIAKKPQVMTTAAAAFSTSFGDESLTETKSDDENAKAEPSTSAKEAIMAIASSVTEKTQKVDEEKSEATKKSDKKSRRGGKLKEKRFSEESPICSKESREGRAKDEESSSSVSSSGRKNKSDEANAKKSGERVTRASIRTSLIKSYENSKANLTKTPEEKSTQRRSSNAKSDKSTSSKKDAGEDSEKKKKKTRRGGVKKMLRRLKSIAAEKSSNATKSVEQSSEKSEDKEQMEQKKKDGESSKAIEEPKKTDEAEKKRRCSIDEDEEALRALLLASLPKRTKTVEATQSTPTTITTATISQPSEATMEASAENSASKVADEPTPNLIDSTVASVKSSAVSNQSLGAISASQAKVEGTTTINTEAATINTEATENIVASKSIGSDAEASPLTPRKRSSSVVIKGPPKKIVKKALPVLASTKVVNNAKKYQNALLQKKMNLQRAAMSYSVQNGSRNITLNNLKSNDAARPSSPKISAASKTQRLVINLGSDTDSEAELENQAASNGDNGETQTEIRKPLAIPTTDFEKSVVQFLKDQRKKLESSAVSKASATTTPTVSKMAANSASPATAKLSGLYNTPLAVRRHLPMSQQEEYRRLKQQIMERERQKLQKTIENGSLNPSLKSPCTPPGPLSPASPIAAAAQKSQTNQKAPTIASQVTTASSPSNKDKTPENLAQKKIELAKANENRPNVTKVYKTIVPAISNKQLTKPLASSSKLNSNIPNIPPSANPSQSVPKIPTIIPPKANSTIPTTNFPSNTSTPKSHPIQSSITSKTYVSASSRAASLPLAKATASLEEIRGKFDAPSTSKKSFGEPSTSIGNRWTLETISVPSSSSGIGTTSVSRRSSNPTEMLTIQIPNDKIQTDRVTSMGISKRESSSPPNGRNVGMLKILTKEQLNSRFVQIKVKQGSSGRTVTVGGSSLSQDDRSASSSPIANILPEGRSDKGDKTMFCDSSFIVNESTRRGDKRVGGESMVGISDASTLILSRSDSRKDEVADSEASTLILQRENAQNNSNVDSEASTFVIINNDNSEGRGSPGLARVEGQEDGMEAAPKQTKVQAKEQWEKIKSDVRSELQILTALPTEQQRVILMESQENLVAKRNMILDDLTAMSGCLRQWEVEREIQTRLVEEVRRLRDQLRTAERHLQEQRRQMKGMGPKVSKAHEKINQGRRECYKLSRICHGLGTNIIGDDYKVPDTGAQLLNERMREVAVHTRQLSKKKVPPVDLMNNSRETSSPASSSGSDNVSENSLMERPPNSTTPLSETINVEETTNSLTSESDLENTRFTRENLETLEISNIDSPRPNSLCERMDPPAEKVEEKSSEAKEIPSNEIAVSESSEKVAETNSGEGSSETNAETVENETCLLEKNAQTMEKIAPSSSDCNTNDSSDIPATNFISEDRFEDIPMASTSKSYPHGQLLSSGEKPRVRTKIDPYKSVLTHLKASRSANPDGILCPYELMGTCSDGDCQFYHLDPGHCQ